MKRAIMAGIAGQDGSYLAELPGASKLAAHLLAGRRREDWAETDPALVRPVEVGQRVGDPSRAGKFPGWHPVVGFPAPVHMMVDAQLERLKGAR